MMQELAKEYKKSLKILTQRIDKFLIQKRKLKAAYKDPDRYQKIKDIDDRLKPLLRIQKELTEVTTVVRRYYQKGYWRNEKYTLNHRKSRKPLYVGPIRE